MSNTAAINEMRRATDDLTKILASLVFNLVKAGAIALEEDMIEKRLKGIIEDGGNISIKDKERMRELGKGLNEITVAEEDFEDFERLLHEAGVGFSVTDVKTDDTKMITFLRCHVDRVKAAQEMLLNQVELKNEVSVEAFQHMYHKQNVGTLEGLNEVDYQLFKENAKKINLKHAINFKEKKLIIYYDLEDREKFNKVMLGVGLDSTGKSGYKIRDKVNHKINNRITVRSVLKDKSQNHYIVSSDNPKVYIKLTRDDFTYYKNGKPLSSLNRDEKEFNDLFFSKVEGISKSAILTEKEFSLPEDKRKIILNDRTSFYPNDIEFDYSLSQGRYSDNHKREAIDYTSKFIKSETILERTGLAERKEGEFERILREAKERAKIVLDRKSNKGKEDINIEEIKVRDR